MVMGLAGAGNIGVVIDALLAPRLAAAYGWPAVFGFAIIPAVFVLAVYCLVAKEPPVKIVPRFFPAGLITSTPPGPVEKTFPFASTWKGRKDFMKGGGK